MSVADLCYVDDGERYAVYRSQRVVARRAHRCYECHRAIAPGETCESVSGLYDGRWERLRTCARCLAVRDYVTAHVPCVGWLHGSMLDDLEAFTCEARWEPDYPTGLHFGCLRRIVVARKGVAP